MTIGELRAIAYQYFPKGIDNLAEHDRYVNSSEFQNLRSHSNKLFEKEEIGDFNVFYDTVKSLDFSKNFHNATLFNLGDRAFNLQLAEEVGEKHYSVCLNISTVVPYYLIYVLETTIIDTKNEPDSFGIPRITKPFRNAEKENHYKILMEQMSLAVEAYFDVKPFPEELLEIIITDITLETIRFGQFTFFNAFFLDSYYIRI